MTADEPKTATGSEKRGAYSAGVLYVVATPIGNLDDISSRARTVLQAVALIAAEDTRHSGRLLQRLGIDTPMMALHEHNEAERVAGLITRLAAGESIALVSDAGTPLVSDPGYRLVAAAREQGIAVTAVPGCCAAIAALSIAGLPTDRFHFEGFLPAKAQARRTRLEALRAVAHTLVFYESVHRIEETVADLIEVFGAARPAFVARELTKLHETVYQGRLGEVADRLAADTDSDKGEYTLVVAGAAEAEPEDAELERVVRVLAAELPASQAATLAARITGGARRDAYRMAVATKPSGAHGADES